LTISWRHHCHPERVFYAALTLSFEFGLVVRTTETVCGIERVDKHFDRMNVH
jgi:hypothetical protein